MKSTPIVNTFIKVIPLLIIGSLLFSCSDTSKSQKQTQKKPQKESTQEIETKKTVQIEIINTEYMKSWNTIRVNPDLLTSTLMNTGNKFTFSSHITDTIIHGYIGYNKDNNELNLTFVNGNKDTKDNVECLVSVNSLNTKDTLPMFTPTSEHNIDSISWKNASNRIKNWVNDEIRDNWIQQTFNAKEEIVQAFVIKNIDFKAGFIHNCYLGLKFDSKRNIYTPDLIIVNNKMTKMNLEDLTAPIPPFKPNTSQDKSNFGLLNNL